MVFRTRLGSAAGLGPLHRPCRHPVGFFKIGDPSSHQKQQEQVGCQRADPWPHARTCWPSTRSHRPAPPTGSDDARRPRHPLSRRSPPCRPPVHPYPVMQAYPKKAREIGSVTTSEVSLRGSADRSGWPHRPSEHGQTRPHPADRGSASRPATLIPITNTKIRLKTPPRCALFHLVPVPVLAGCAPRSPLCSVVLPLLVPPVRFKKRHPPGPALSAAATTAVRPRQDFPGLSTAVHSTG